METEFRYVLVGGPRDGWTNIGVPFPRIQTVEFEGVATYVRPLLREGQAIEYRFDSMKPHNEPLATSMRLAAQGISPSTQG